MRVNEKKANNLFWLSFAGYVFFFALAHWVSPWFLVPTILSAIAMCLFLFAWLAIHFYQLGKDSKGEIQ